MSAALWQHIVEQIDPHGRFLRSWELKGGLSAKMTAVEFQTGGNSTDTIVVRQPNTTHQQAIQQEYQILSAVYQSGTTAPKPLHYGTSPDINQPHYLVMSHINGAPHYSQSFTTNMGAKVAQQLLNIHQTRPLYTSGWHEPLPNLAQIAEKQFAWEPKMRLEQFHESAIRHLLQQERPWLADQTKHGLLHGDYWPGNWLWQDQELVGIVDWEDTQYGHPLADVAVTRFDLSFIFGQNIMQAFTAAYLTNSIFEPKDLAVWDLYAALRAMHGIQEWASGWSALGRPDITFPHIQKKLSDFIQATDLL